jgi:hypothetical protein
MKQSWACLAVFLALAAASASGEGMRVRAYGSFGYTVAPPSLASLDYDNGTDWTEKANDLNAGAGVQLVFPGSAINLVAEAGFSTFYTLEIDNRAYLATNYYDDFYDSSDFIYIDALAEKRLGGFFVQGGGGIYLDLSTYRYRHYFNGVLQDSYSVDDSSVDFKLGLAAAAGTDIALSPNIKVFGLVRGDLVFAYGAVFDLRALVGLDVGL